MKTKIIYIWPDGTWCLQRENRSYRHMDNSYEAIRVPDNWDCNDIDYFVHYKEKPIQVNTSKCKTCR